MRDYALVAAALLTSSSTVYAQFDTQRSHIEANVPRASEFDALLQRDLVAFFRQNGFSNTDQVEVRLLRDAPTQSGVAYPKYYAWVVATANAKPLQQGVVRLEAINRARFEVTDFVSQSQIKSGSVELERIFPAALIPAIRQLAGI